MGRISKMAKQQSADVSDPAAGLNSLPESLAPRGSHWLPLNFTERRHVCPAARNKLYQVPMRGKGRDVSF
jgi:hypothetical protein